MSDSIAKIVDYYGKPDCDSIHTIKVIFMFNDDAFEQIVKISGDELGFELFEHAMDSAMDAYVTSIGGDEYVLEANSRRYRMNGLEMRKACVGIFIVEYEPEVFRGGAQ